MHIYKDGNPFNGVLVIDGYGLDSEFFEGVYFEIDVKNGVMVENSFRVHNKRDENYFQMFNKEYWAKRCVEYIANGRGPEEVVEVEELMEEIVDGYREA